MLPEHDRRTFLTALGRPPPPSPRPPPPRDGKAVESAPGGVDITWVDAFKGKHKQVFDLRAFDLSLDTPFRQVVTYLSVHLEIQPARASR